MLVGIVALLVFGPERLPEAMRTFGLWLGRARRTFNRVWSDVERELGADEIRRQLHNESIIAEARRLQQDLDSAAGDLRKAVDGGMRTPWDDVAAPAPGAGPAAAASVPVAGGTGSGSATGSTAVPAGTAGPAGARAVAATDPPASDAAAAVAGNGAGTGAAVAPPAVTGVDRPP